MTISKFASTSTSQRQVSVAALFVLLSFDAHAAVSAPTGPSTSVDGNYTVLYPVNEETSECDTIVLEERSSTSTNWSYVPDSEHDGSVTIVNQHIGLFEYRSHAYCEDYYAEYSWDEFSSIFTVQVGNTPTVDTLGQQLSYEYETRVGDIDGDGRQDIYIDRLTVADDGNGSLDEILMQQQPGGTYVTSVPTSLQKNAATGWPVSDIYSLVVDVNLDGFADIFLPDLDESIPGSQSQIVFAPGEIYQTQPMGTTAIDGTVSQFLDEFRSWIDDSSYFYDNAELEIIPAHWETQIVCDLVWFGSWFEYICDTDDVWIDEEEIWHYDHFNQDALELSEQFGLQGPQIPGEISTEEGGIIESIFERVFGVGVFGGVLSSGGIGSWEIEFGLGSGDRGLGLSIVIYDIAEETAPKDWRHYTLGEKVFLSANGFEIPRIDKVELRRREYGPAKAFGFDNQVIAPNGHIYIPVPNDAFITGGLPWSEDYMFEDEWALGTLLHESFHVYQKKKRMKVPGIFWLKAVNREYLYDIEPGKDFWDYKQEQEAMIIMERWFFGAAGSRTGYDPTVTMEELIGVIPFTCIICL